MAEGAYTFMLPACPTPGIQYPLNVIYCPPEICDSWPLEYCEFHPGNEKAKEWMEKNLSDEVRDLLVVGDADDNADGVNGEKKSDRLVVVEES